MTAEWSLRTSPNLHNIALSPYIMMTVSSCFPFPQQETLLCSGNTLGRSRRLHQFAIKRSATNVGACGLARSKVVSQPRFSQFRHRLSGKGSSAGCSIARLQSRDRQNTSSQITTHCFAFSGGLRTFVYLKLVRSRIFGAFCSFCHFQTFPTA